MSKKDLFFLILLGFIPVSIAAEWLHWNPLLVFVTACLAIVPLAAWMGQATEELAGLVGPSVGGLLNATFGNATELIVALVALKEGYVGVVKASLTGSIIGNLLLVMGLSMLLGGLRFKEQTFQPVAARMNASSMNLAVIAMLLPTAVNFTSVGIAESVLQKLSTAVAIVLIVVYLMTLLFSMKTHSYLYDVAVAEGEVPNEAGEIVEASGETHKPNLPLWVGVLLAATVFVAIESELLVNSLETATDQLGLTELFTGVILLPIIGNAAEHATAVTVAMKNKMDLSVSVAMGSSLQIALFVAPVLVLAGWFFGQPMDLNFQPFELVAVAVSVLIANSISSDGQSNWLEGLLLLAAYLVLGLAFFFHPNVAV
ncbi:MAG: calcium/proton exchanger [Oscillatoriales cyanobacterium]|nr:MAG: calcium/proton exchanger [Oscillatoriales cyanobacterium]